MYGSECWPVSKMHERMLNTAEMRMPRWACGFTRRDEVRNEDIRTLMQTAPIQLKLREQRLRWFGHVMRRPPLHPTRQALEMEAILSDSEMNQLIVYRFIILLGICDIVEASVHCMTGFALIFQQFWSISLGNLLGSILVPAYFCCILTGLILSFVRFIQVVYPEYATVLFSSKRGKYWLIIVAAVFLPYFGLMFSPLSMCAFSLTSYTWEYDLGLPMAYFILYIDQYVKQTMIGVTCVLYVIIFVVLWRLVKSLSLPFSFTLTTLPYLINKNRKLFKGSVHNTSSHRERLIMYQTFFVTIYATMQNITYHNMWYVDEQW
ncbi:hypothetical protein ANCDUO_12521 [Ancylostoma duodenale]|uniref:7TM GPCR serpentine receptor class x (Srx) domain-containing protein n=1 Tax=Ancylostoma duodenale TaxID=51022 RepID=A0A0C2GED1_9BILA|nr:hypothetical protein ANCDUO_12521 [Ancylostoma duodenale]